MPLPNQASLLTLSKTPKGSPRLSISSKPSVNPMNLQVSAKGCPWFALPMGFIGNPNSIENKSASSVDGLQMAYVSKMEGL